MKLHVYYLSDTMRVKEVYFVPIFELWIIYTFCTYNLQNIDGQEINHDLTIHNQDY